MAVVKNSTVGEITLLAAGSPGYCCSGQPVTFCGTVPSMCNDRSAFNPDAVILPGLNCSHIQANFISAMAQTISESSFAMDPVAACAAEPTSTDNSIVSIPTNAQMVKFAAASNAQCCGNTMITSCGTPDSMCSEPSQYIPNGRPFGESNPKTCADVHALVQRKSCTQIDVDEESETEGASISWMARIAANSGMCCASGASINICASSPTQAAEASTAICVAREACSVDDLTSTVPGVDVACFEAIGAATGINKLHVRECDGITSPTDMSVACKRAVFDQLLLCTGAPTTVKPTEEPTLAPTDGTSSPTPSSDVPSVMPTTAPTVLPSNSPATPAPITADPTAEPTSSPTQKALDHTLICAARASCPEDLDLHLPGLPETCLKVASASDVTHGLIPCADIMPGELVSSLCKQEMNQRWQTICNLSDLASTSAEAVSTPLPTDHAITDTGSSSKEESSGTSFPMLVGIIIGCVVIVAIAVVIVLILMQRKDTRMAESNGFSDTFPSENRAVYNPSYEAPTVHPGALSSQGYRL